MRNLLTITFIALLILGCSTKTQKSENRDEPKEQQVNHVLENEEQDYNGSKIWVGEITEENFEKEPYSQWYNENYDMFKVNQEVVDQFKDKLQEYDVTVFMGAWCPDSKSLTPEFFKVMEAADYPDDRIKMYALDRNKKGLNGEEEGKNIGYVPTFIFYKNGVEVNRIVESPINTLEEDIHDIVLGKEYIPNYAE